jgi:AraC-like DNA-binding protein
MTRHASKRSSMEVSARIGTLIAGAVAARGVDPGPLCAAAGFDPASAADPAARISLELEQTLWETAAEQTGDPSFGLHTAESIEPGVFDVLDYAIRTAPSLGVALERLVRYSRLEHEAAVFQLIASGDVTRIEHSFGPAVVLPCRQEAEFTLAAVVMIGREIIVGGIQPIAVEFMHGIPLDTSEHIRIFGVLPRFAAHVNAVELDGATMSHRLLTADPALSRIIERHAEASLGSVAPVSESTTEEVRGILVKALPEGPCSITTVAPSLGLSQRTLQRRLENEGSTFGDVLDGVRRDLALRYLEDGKLTLSEIAYLLGYSEPSPFHRAFKRWTGSTPQALRSESKRRFVK